MLFRFIYHLWFQTVHCMYEIQMHFVEMTWNKKVLKDYTSLPLKFNAKNNFPFFHLNKTWKKNEKNVKVWI